VSIGGIFKPGMDRIHYPPFSPTRNFRVQDKKHQGAAKRVRRADEVTIEMPDGLKIGSPSAWADRFRTSLGGQAKRLCVWANFFVPHPEFYFNKIYYLHFLSFVYPFFTSCGCLRNSGSGGKPNCIQKGLPAPQGDNKARVLQQDPRLSFASESLTTKLTTKLTAKLVRIGD
jgi:hypothetical protein